MIQILLGNIGNQETWRVIAIISSFTGAITLCFISVYHLGKKKRKSP